MNSVRIRDNISFVGSEESNDAAAFAEALQPKHSEVQYIPPALNPFPGALDVLLFRSVLLVVYSAGSQVIIANGSNLATLRRISYPKARHCKPRAVAFRSSDAALAVSFGKKIVVFSGWNPKVKSSSIMYDSENIEAEFDTIQTHTLSWDKEGKSLAAIGNGIAVWKITSPNCLNSNDVSYELYFSIPLENMPHQTPFTVGSISPDGSLLFASSLYSRTSWLWEMSQSSSAKKEKLSRMEIEHGSTGIATMDWKRRGGGNPAVMTVDQDATVRLWVYVPCHLRKGGPWIQEIARAPHLDHTKRAGASFVNWGGGGGSADDEEDAWATGSGDPLNLSSVVPKPSRCLHWIARVAAGSLQAWRLQGVDDRPVAVYARLKPGSGDAMLGAEQYPNSDTRPEIPGRPSLTDVSIFATKSVAPYPLTCSTRHKAGVVRSYAISNGERLLRNPEPPNPPSTLAVFVLVGNKGNTFLSRYDTGATTNIPPICRARVGIGHRSKVVDVQTFEDIPNFGSRGWLVSLGSSGDALVWRTEIPTGVRELVSVTARLNGPCHAVAFAPQALVSSVLPDALGIFALDSYSGRLNLFTISSRRRLRTKPCIQHIEAADLVSSCNGARVPYSVSHRSLLYSFSHISGRDEGPVICSVLRVLEDDDIRAWTVSNSKNNAFSITSAKLAINGRKVSSVVASTSCARRQLMVLADKDGMVIMYSVSIESVRSVTSVVLSQFVELCSAAFDSSPVQSVDFSGNGSTICLTTKNGSTYSWEWNGESNVWVPVSSGPKDYVDGKVKSRKPPTLNGITDIPQVCKKQIATRIGLSYCAEGRECGILVRRVRSSTKYQFRSQWAGVLPLLLMGSTVDQIRLALERLNEFAVATMENALLSRVAFSGQRLVLPPPSIEILEKPGQPSQAHHSVTSNVSHPLLELKRTSGGGNVFAELMAKTESKANELRGNAQNEEKGSGISKLLRTMNFPGLHRNERNAISRISNSLTRLSGILSSLDDCGARFAVFVECYRDNVRTTLPPTVISLALHSSSCDALRDYFLPTPSGPARFKYTPENMPEEPEMWNFARSIGAGWWLSTAESAKQLIGRIARSEFNQTREVERAALWYVALGKSTAVAALYKAQRDLRMSKFFLRDFTHPENQKAAAKNAYVLVSKHRLHLAVAFFVLARDFSGALSLIKSRIQDIQLYLLMARVLDGGKHLSFALDSIANLMAEQGEKHLQAMATWLAGNHEQALNTVIEITKSKDKMFQSSSILECDVPNCVLDLNHILAMSERPPLHGLTNLPSMIRKLRWYTVHVLQKEQNTLAALKNVCDLIRHSSGQNLLERECSSSCVFGQYENPEVNEAVRVLSDSIKCRAVAVAGASRMSTKNPELFKQVESDLKNLSHFIQGSGIVVHSVSIASRDLCEADEVDAAIAISLGAVSITNTSGSFQLRNLAIGSLECCLRIAVARSLSRVQCNASLLYGPVSIRHVEDILSKVKSAFLALCESEYLIPARLKGLVTELRWSELALGFSAGFCTGNWLTILNALKACESVNTSKGTWSVRTSERALQNNISLGQVSVEALRHIASNPAVLGISPSISHARRKRRTPSMALVEHHGVSVAALPEDSSGLPKLAVGANDPFALIRIHPALSSTLCACALVYLSSHLASSTSRFERGVEKRRKTFDINSPSVHGFRLVDYAESLEHVANDSIARWLPLPQFGTNADRLSLSKPDAAAGAFVELWTTLGCLPEYAPVLSEAATVAAAELAAAASEESNRKTGETKKGRRSRRNGHKAAALKKKEDGIMHLDTTADVLLHRAYPVRFSASSHGPWSGRGGHATLYKEEGTLMRKLCVSSIDPPSVVVATPKGIQEMVPSSYTTIPARVRAHYLSQSNRKPNPTPELRPPESLQPKESLASRFADDEEIISSISAGFGEGPFIPLSLALSSSQDYKAKRSSLSKNRNKVWRHQVHATALTSHPFRRRFATGGTDGFVRLWDFSDPLCLASLREERSGRVVSLNFSVYGSRIMAVYSSGSVTLWEEPDNYRSLDSELSLQRRRKGTSIVAFENRSAQDGIFVDEKFTIACVGDPMAPPAVGHSLRIFDTREHCASYRASWSTAVHDHGESRCVALLEDRVRLVSGGLNGSLSVVDLRTKGCIAELPAHADEVTCLALEQPRGRAIASGCKNGDLKLWDSRTLLQLDVLKEAHKPTRHYWSGSGFGGLIGSFGLTSLAVTNRSLISCGGDGEVKIWGPGWCDFDLNVL